MRRFLNLSLITLVATLAGVSGSVHPARAQSQTDAPLIVKLAYSGKDALSYGNIFTAQVGNNSNDPIASGSITVNLGYRWSMENADADGWTCVTTTQLTTSCTRALSRIEPHAVDEFSIVMGTAAGVCLAAAPEMTVVAHFPSGNQTTSANAQAPSDCASPLTALPGTGGGASPATHYDRTALVAALTLFFAGAASFGLFLAHRADRRAR